MAILKTTLSLCLTLLASLSFAATADINNHQGAIWNLREAGYEKEAQELEDKVIETLKFADIKEVSQFATRTSKSYLVRFPGNLVAIMKEDDPKVKVSHRYDTASFVMDRALGLNMVPITVARNILGKNYSLQLIYPAMPGPNFEVKGTEFQTPRIWDIQVFDDLIANNDRNVAGFHNVILGIDGRLIAIDHARSFQMDRFERTVRHPSMNIPKTSPQFQQGIANLQLEPLLKELKGLLNAEQYEHVKIKLETTMAALPPQPKQTVKVVGPKPQLPKEFPLLPLAENKVFVDFFAIRSLLGPDSKNQPQSEINRLIESSADKEFVRTQAIENWDYLSAETRNRVLPMFIADKDFASYNSSFIQKILKFNPEFSLPMFANEEFRKNAFPYMARGLAQGEPEVSLNPRYRNLIKQHLVQSQLTNRAGFDFDELFSYVREDYKRVLLGEIYQGMVQAGLQDQVARIFRLQHVKNASLPARLVEAVPLHMRSVVQSQIIRSYEVFQSGISSPETDIYKSLDVLIGTMRRIPLSTPLCEGLF